MLRNSFRMELKQGLAKYKMAHVWRFRRAMAMVSVKLDPRRHVLLESMRQRLFHLSPWEWTYGGGDCSNPQVAQSLSQSRRWREKMTLG